MKKKRFSGEQIVSVLKQAELGVPVGGGDAQGWAQQADLLHPATESNSASCDRIGIETMI